METSEGFDFLVWKSYHWWAERDKIKYSGLNRLFLMAVKPGR